MKMNIIKNFSNYIANMEQNKKPIVKITNGTILITKNGYKLLEYHDRTGIRNKRTQNKDIQKLENLEYWTEEGLENLKKKPF